MCAPAAKMYRPRNPEASPISRLVHDHFDTFECVNAARSQPKEGSWRPVIRTDIDTFLQCGKLREGMSRNFQVFDVLDFLAEVTQQIPGKGQHLIRYFGWYSKKERGMRKKREPSTQVMASISLRDITAGTYFDFLARDTPEKSPYSFFSTWR